MSYVVSCDMEGCNATDSEEITEKEWSYLETDSDMFHICPACMSTKFKERE